MVIVVVGACTSSATNHETLGDQHYVRGGYRDAFSEYQLELRREPDNARLLAKTASAALHAGEFGHAITAFSQLGARNDDRRQEALDGLWRVVEVTADSGDQAALFAALTAVRSLDPSYRLGRYAVQVALNEASTGSAGRALTLLPHAVAAVQGSLTDSILFVYAEVNARSGKCDEATPVYEGLIRRRREPAVLQGARAGIAACALARGWQTLEQEELESAEGYFRRAASPDASLDVARMAWLGLGDVRFGVGDIAGAIEAYDLARGNRVGATDSIARLVEERLRVIGNAESLQIP